MTSRPRPSLLLCALVAYATLATLGGCQRAPLSAAAPPETALLTSVSTTTTLFDPTKDGFSFINDFENYNGAFGGAVDVRTGGLCGGMSYAALDYYYAGIPIPNQTYRPAEGTTLQQYLYNRQVTSVDSNLDRWTELQFNIFGWRSSEFFKWGLQGTGGGQLQNLRASLDQGLPVPLGLKGVGDQGDHQVVAYGYDMGDYQGDLGAHEEDLKIYILDPDYPLVAMTLVPDLQDEYYTYAEAPGHDKYVTYFVDENYAPAAPPADLAIPTYPIDDSAHELLFVLKTGADDLRGGNDNIDATLNLVDGTTLSFPNLNQGHRWISNYDQTIRVVLPQPLKMSQILTVTLSDTFTGGDGGDNWDMETFELDGLVNNLSQIFASDGYRRFTAGSDDGIRSDTVQVTVPTDAVSSLELTILTGDDNLGDNGNTLDATIVLQDGTTMTTNDLNHGGHFASHSTNVVTLWLTKPVAPGALAALRLHTTSGGGVSADNWDLTTMTVRAKGGGIDRIVGVAGSFRFKGDDDPNGTDNNLSVLLEGGSNTATPMINSLSLVFQTGSDNFGDNGNTLDATLTLAGQPPLSFPNIVNGGHFDGNTTSVVTLVLPQLTDPTLLQSLNLHTTSGAGLSSDNWDMTRVDVYQEGDSGQILVGFGGPKRFKGDNDDGPDSNLLIALTGYAPAPPTSSGDDGDDGVDRDVCSGSVVLTPVAPTIELTSCGAPLTLTVPSAHDACTGAPVPVSGTLATADGTPVALAADGVFSSPVVEGTLVVTWTASGGAAETQTVTLVSPGPTMTLWSATDVKACAAVTASTLPLPIVESACPGVGVTGTIVSANGQALSPPIAVAANGLISGPVPTGMLQVVWTATDSSGVHALSMSQSFHFTDRERPEVAQLSNGDMQFTIGGFKVRQAYVEAFVRQNGVQNISGNIVASQVVAPDGTFSYSRVVPASTYHLGDVIDVRFYAYAAGKPGVFFPGPVGPVSYPDFNYGSTSCAEPLLPPVSQGADGSVTFTVSFPTAQSYVEAFVKVDGVQVASGDISGSGVTRPDGTFAYHRALPASAFHHGSRIEVRYYSYVAGRPGVFTPGPDATKWLPPTFYQ